MADNPYLQVSHSVLSVERFVVLGPNLRRLERRAGRCYGAGAAAGSPPEADIVLL